MKEKKKHVTPAEQHLVKTLIPFLSECHGETPRILNIGCGRSILIEKQLRDSGNSFICDRADLEFCKIYDPSIKQIFQCSVENMELVESGKYDIVFANYLLEHIQHINKAATEIYRVLKHGGIFVTTVPNPTSLESLMVKWTPLWFHKKVRGKEAWTTFFNYKNIKTLCEFFQKAGFVTVNVQYWSFLISYLKRFIILKQLANLYDKTLNTVKYKRFMNNVCIVFKKPHSIC